MTMEQQDDTPAPADNVVHHARFKRTVAPEQLTQLREDGILIASTKKIDDLTLPEPQPGEIVIGQLTPAETEVFINFYEANSLFKATQRKHVSAGMHKLGDAIERDEQSFALGDHVHPQEMKDLFRLSRRVECLKAWLFWMIGERLDFHDYVIGFRSKSRIVRGDRKY